MKALVYTGPGHMEFLDVPDPQPRPGEVLLRVRLASICGVDLQSFRGRNSRVQPPAILGHEVVGTVVSVPDDSHGFVPGDRVAVDPLFPCGQCENCSQGRPNLCSHLGLLGTGGLPGVFAEYVCVPVGALARCPEYVTNIGAILAEPLANAIHLLGVAQPDRDARIAIFGAGVQGILFLQIAHARGYSNIAVIDRNRQRLEIAELLGAEPAILHPRDGVEKVLNEWTRGRGVDVAIDAAGTAVARRLCASVVRAGGRIVLLGLRQPQTLTDVRHIVRRELDVRGSFGYTPADFAASLDAIAEGLVYLDPWFRCMSLRDGLRAFTLAERRGSLLKTLLLP